MFRVVVFKTVASDGDRRRPGRLCDGFDESARNSDRVGGAVPVSRRLLHRMAGDGDAAAMLPDELLQSADRAELRSEQQTADEQRRLSARRVIPQRRRRRTGALRTSSTLISVRLHREHSSSLTPIMPISNLND